MTDTKQLSRERYSQFAGGYVTSATHAGGADLDRLLALARPRSSWHVLDIATGGGHTALKFASRVRAVTAVDLTPAMLAKAEDFVRGQGVGNVSFIPADAEDLPFDDEQFDLATCRIAAHHFPDAGKFVREAARVLKPGGLLLVQDHVLPDYAEAAQVVDGFERLRDPSHNRAFTHDAWCSMFAAAGLTVEHSEEIVKRHAFLDWAKRQGNSTECIDRLVEMVRNASADVQAWMQIEAWGTAEASFVNHHIIIAGRKTGEISG